MEDRNAGGRDGGANAANNGYEIDFEKDSFADIVARDDRYDARSYALLMDVVDYLGSQGGHFSGEDILEEFKERTLDLYGPMAFTVLTEWGVKSCADVGEMMFNLADAKRVQRDTEDGSEAFAGGYDFEEAFLGPYRADGED